MFAVPKENDDRDSDAALGGSSGTGAEGDGAEGEGFVAGPVPSFLPPHPVASKRPITSKAETEIIVVCFMIHPSLDWDC